MAGLDGTFNMCPKTNYSQAEPFDSLLEKYRLKRVPFHLNFRKWTLVAPNRETALKVRKIIKKTGFLELCERGKLERPIDFFQEGPRDESLDIHVVYKPNGRIQHSALIDRVVWPLNKEGLPMFTDEELKKKENVELDKIYTTTLKKAALWDEIGKTDVNNPFHKAPSTVKKKAHWQEMKRKLATMLVNKKCRLEGGLHFFDDDFDYKFGSFVVLHNLFASNFKLDHRKCTLIAPDQKTLNEVKALFEDGLVKVGDLSLRLCERPKHEGKVNQFGALIGNYAKSPYFIHVEHCHPDGSRLTKTEFNGQEWDINDAGLLTVSEETLASESIEVVKRRFSSALEKLNLIKQIGALAARDSNHPMEPGLEFEKAHLEQLSQVIRKALSLKSSDATGEEVAKTQ